MLSAQRAKYEGAGAVVLAAGKGTRMKSEMNKVLHDVLGRPLVSWVLALAAEMESVVVVGGHQYEQLVTTVERCSERYSIEVECVLQAEQLGTGHAVLQAEHVTRDWGWLFVLYGDVPALRAETLAKLWDAALHNGTLAVLTFETPDPSGYGRIVRGSNGRVKRIVEDRDCDDDERAIREVNAGIYCVRRAFCFEQLAALRTNNAQGEYYLTDVVAAVPGGAEAVRADEREVQGVNTRLDLVTVAHELQQRIIRHWMLGVGVTFIAPERTLVEPDVTIGRDTIIAPGVALRGRTEVGPGCRIEQGVLLENVTLAEGTTVGAYSVLRDQEFSVPGEVIRPQTLRLGPDEEAGWSDPGLI
ncbi:MAG: bifunctional N-acetylglucosamine-1-phosphate uridyltransferase/glucosamine-1-phosphate acetyltransferase [Myxococcales bacterium]|nr:bifunctional N-acetylglucosamine-1-phosphate uridyltransferase/glucosamine-1-phosphate acetyltransferase [Myxococcales bacterium]